jgi:opacity protein-like surface antigen
MKTAIRTFVVVGTAWACALTDVPAQYRSFITQDAGPYFRVNVGPSIPQDGHLTDYGGLTSGNAVSYDVGLMMDFVGGYAFNKWAAVELEVGWNFNEIGSIQGFSQSDTFFYNFPILANLVLQYPIPRTRIVPYVGGGVGGSATIFDTDGLYFPAGSFTPTSVFGSDSDFVFAYQAFAGLQVELNDKMLLGLGYRYFFSDRSSYSYPPLVYGFPNLNLGLSEFQAHTVTVWFTMKF